MSLKSVATRLDGLSKRLLLRILLVGIPLVLLLAVLLAFASYALDRGLELPTPVRVVLTALAVASLGRLAWRRVLKPLGQKPGLLDLARIAETNDPSLNSELISALQLEEDLRLGRTVESKELIQAHVEAAVQRFARRDFARSVSLRPTQRPLALGALALFAFALSASAFPTEARIWAERSLLFRDTPWPRVHDLIVTIQDMERYSPKIEDDRIILFVPERTALLVQVSDARGNLPSEVELLVQTEGDSATSRIAMGRPGTAPHFQHAFPPLLRSMSFSAAGGDDDDGRPLYEIRVAKAPRIQRFTVAYDYPEYTGLVDKQLEDANITAPEGTRVTATFRANMPLARFELAFEQAGTVELRADAAGDYHHSFVVESNDFYTYRLRGQNDVQSPDVPRYVVTSERDQLPRVVATMPDATNLIVTPNAIIPLAGLARDDYGVESAGFRIGLERGQLEAGGVDFGPADFAADDRPAARERRFFHALRVQDLVRPERPETPERPLEPSRPFAEGDRFHFRFRVTDNRRTAADPEPHRAFGDFEYQVQVLSSEDLQRDLATRQVRLRGRVQEISDSVRTRIAETEAYLASDVEGGENARATLSRLEQDQRRITTELESSTRQFLRVFDGYLWNRVDDKSALTDRLIASFARAYRSGASDEAFRIYGGAIAENEPLINDTDLIGRLTGLSRRFLKCAGDLSPEAARRLSRALLIDDPREAKGYAREALAMQRDLERELHDLVLGLEAWEDYIDIIQSFRDLLQTQEGVQRRIQDATKKR